MRIFTVLHRFAETGEGDVKKLKGESGEMPNARVVGMQRIVP
jgi:hypothetical protein